MTSTALSFVGTAAYYIAYAVVLQRAIHGTIDLGTLTMLAAAFARSRDVTQGILLSASNVYEQALYLQDLVVFLQMRPAIMSKPDAVQAPTAITDGIVFHNVGFQYPGSDRWTIQNVNLVIRPGERIALVGSNGAGKTTLTKLLARLYDPTEGRITIDGIDLRDIELSSLRQIIGVVFQDFVRYDLRFDENIGLGHIEAVRADLDVDDRTPSAIVEAATRADADSLLSRLPAGYRQMLGRRFDSGVDLSGGEWQKIALARAYIRDASILVLDEPTAALDARAEFEVFRRFADLVSGRIALLISHRFSTARMADRIIVLEHGHIIEQGSHDELVTCGGLYAELFEIQAVGYR